jgi:hypothetical protein
MSLKKNSIDRLLPWRSRQVFERTHGLNTLQEMNLLMRPSIRFEAAFERDSFDQETFFRRALKIGNITMKVAP